MRDDVMREYPVLPYFICFAIGIVLAFVFRPGQHILFIAAGAIVSARFGARKLKLRTIGISWIMAIIISCSLAGQQLSMHEQWLHYFPEQDGKWTGYVTSVPSDEAVWYLHLYDWEGVGKPKLRIVPSQFHPPSDTWDALRIGDVVTVSGTLRHSSRSGNPGEVDWQAYYLQQGIVGTVYVEHVEIGEAPQGTRRKTIEPILHSLRKRFVGIIYDNASAQAAPVLVGMIFGFRSALPEHIETVFRRTGLSHLLAVSGFHVGIVAGLAWFFGRICRLSRSWQAVLVVAIVWCFIMLTGGRPSALRAGIVGTLVALHHVVRRPAEPLNVWATAGCIILLLQPLTLFDAGFQLSFAASGTILLWLDVARQHLFRFWVWAQQRRKRGSFGLRLHNIQLQVMQYVMLSLVVSISAQLGTAGFVAYYFQELALVGIVANVFVAPLIAPVVTATLWGMLLTFVWPRAGGMFIVVAGKVIDTFISFLERIAQWSWVSLEVSVPSALTAWGLAAFVIGFPLVFHMTSVQRRRIGASLICFTLLVWNGAVWFPIYEAHAGVVEVTFLDVGQGDAIVVRTPRGAIIVIDGGGNPRRDEQSFVNIGDARIVPYFRRRGIRHIAAVINTHPDEDHLQGLVPVLRERNVAMIIDSGQIRDTKTYNEYNAVRNERSIPHLPLKRGSSVIIDDVEFHIIHPPHTDEDKTMTLNDYSIVIRMLSEHGTALLTGDISRQVQQELLWQAKNVHVQADVIKVPHHGSRYDVDLRFIHAVSPQIAVIQVGRNSYGHPADETLAAYRRFGTQVWRTDYHGAITVKFRPSGMHVTSHREGEAL